MARSGAWILLVSLAASATAQDAGHFGQLIGVIEPGDHIRVALSSEGLVRPAQVVWRGFANRRSRLCIVVLRLVYQGGSLPGPFPPKAPRRTRHTSPVPPRRVSLRRPGGSF